MERRGRKGGGRYQYLLGFVREQFYVFDRVSARTRKFPTKPRFRSVSDVADTKFANPNGFAY